MTGKYGLIFDVDGVIADTEAVSAVVTIDLFDKMLGIPGVVRSDFQAGLGRGAEEYIRAGGRKHGIELSEDKIAKVAKAREKGFLERLRRDPLPPFPGVLDLIQSAMDRGDFSLAIATSSTREKSEAVLISASVPYRSMVYVNGSEITNRKPDPELFLTACRRMKMPPERCVVIEDAPNGIQAAISAGCRCIAVTNSLPAEDLSAADIIVDSLKYVSLDAIITLVNSR